MRLCCNCAICHGYLTSSWAQKFDNLSDWYAHLLRQSPTGTIRIHILGSTITANPQNVEHMLKTRFHNYPKGQTFSSILRDLLGNGIFNVDGDAWRFQRKMASLELGSVSVRTHSFQIVTSVVQKSLLPLLSAHSASGRRVLDMQDIFQRFAFDAICNISFGIDPGCLAPSMPTSELVAAFDLASKLTARRAGMASQMVWKVKRLLNIGSEKELKAAIGVINRLAAEVISERRKTGFSNRHDLLSRFMLTVVDDDSFLRDIVVSFLLSGRDTVASGLTSFFWLISASPNVECKIRIEMAEVMGAETVPTFDHLRLMDYTHAALHESLRLYPPVQFDSKFAAEDDNLPDGTFVRRGTRVTYHPYAMGRMEEVWGPDCLEFRPERWMKNGRFCPESPFRYPVFQGGLRVCLGKEMALMQMKTVAVSLMQRFKVETLRKECRPKFLPGLIAALEGGLPAVLHEIGGVASDSDGSTRRDSSG